MGFNTDLHDVALQIMSNHDSITTIDFVNTPTFLAIILTLNAANGQSIVHPANNEAFIRNEVAEVHIQLHPNDLTPCLR